MSKEINKKKNEENKELEELKNLVQRVQADFENFRKRSQKEREEFARYLNSDLIMRVIPILDNFRLALVHLPKELESNEWVHGIWHIEKQLEAVLTEEGLEEMPALGKKFDPTFHEALEEVPSEKPESEIVEIISAGYLLNGKVIRPAKVKVSKGSSEQEQK